MAVRKLNLLIVDDDPVIVRIVEHLVRQHVGEDFAVTCFADVREALVWIETNCCDILLSDIEMPGCDGLELHRRVKQRNPWTQTIFLTAHSSWDRITTAIEQGASDYLLKPVDRRELVTLLNQQRARFGRWHTATHDTWEAEPAAAQLS